MKATDKNFTGTAGQKNFATDIVNSALWLLDKRVQQYELKINRYTEEEKDVNSLRRSLVECHAKKDQIETFITSAKKIAAKKIIEGSRKNDAIFMAGQGWIIEIEI